MKFSNVVFLAAGALASVMPRDVPESTTDINNIITLVGSLDTAVKGFSGPNDVATLTSASSAVVSAINKANSDAASIPNGSITTSTDGFNDFLNAISDLVTAVKSVVSDLTTKRSDFAGFGLCPEVLNQINGQQKAAAALQTTLISKITSELQSTANTFAMQITQALGQAATAYQNCPASTVSPTSTGPTTTGSSMPISSVPTTLSTSCSESTSTPPAYTTSSCPETTSTPPAYTTTTSTPPAYPTTTSCPESSSIPPSTPPPYVSSPPPYVSSPVAPTGTAPWTPIVSPTTNGTVPVPVTPTIVPNTNAGAKSVAGFGGLFVAVAAAALAAF